MDYSVFSTCAAEGQCMLHVTCAKSNEELVDLLIDTVDDLQPALNIRFAALPNAMFCVV